MRLTERDLGWEKVDLGIFFVKVNAETLKFIVKNRPCSPYLFK